MRRFLSSLGAAAVIASAAMVGTPAAAGAAGRLVASSPASHAPASPVSPAPAKVPSADTDGRSAAALAANARQLLNAGMQGPAVTTDISGIQAKLEADVRAARRAQAEASAATARAAAANAEVISAERAYKDMSGAVKAAALYLYMSGGTTMPALSLATANRNAVGASYEDSTIGPAGVLETSFQLAAQKEVALAALETQRAEAESAYRRVDKALTAEKAQVASLQATLANAPGVSAGTVANDQLTVASQAAGEVAHPAALQFTTKTPLPAPLSTTSTALAWAFSELGKPYLWGGTGPDAFDCSGLTQYVWNKAGVQIPRVAADQYAWTVPIPLSQLLPGDLVFYGTTDIHHVGIYIGDGLMINAPHTGTVVQVSSIWWSDLAGFGRVHDAQTPVPARAIPTAAAPAAQAVVASAGLVPSQPGGSPAASSPPAPAAPSGSKPFAPQTPNTTSTPPRGNAPATAPTTPPATAAPATTTTAPATTTTTTDPSVVPTTPTTAPATTTTTPGGPLGL